MKWMLCLLTLVTVSASAQNRGFKPYFNSGLELYNNKDYEGALEQFQKAWSIEQKAQRYKVSGAFFNDYLPRYYHALCYEQLGRMEEAAEWATNSEAAGEGDVTKKKARVDYNTNIARIKKAAEQFHEALAAKYDGKLKEARALLAANKFDEARSALQELSKIDAKRTEAGAELAALPGAMNNYLRGKGLDAKEAIGDENFGRAEGIIQSMALVDSTYDELPILRSRLKEARKEAVDIETARLAALEASKKPSEVKVETPKTHNPITRDPAPVRTAENKPKANSNTHNPTAKPERKVLEPTGPSAEEKLAMKRDLVATLESYRLGNPDQALKQLLKIDEGLAQQSGSYYWLKAVYLLESNTQLIKPKEDLLRQAREALQQTAKMFPDFEPAADLYPNYVLDFYRENRSATEP